MIKNLIFLIALLPSVTLCAQEEIKSTEKFLEELDHKVPQLLSDFSVPGAAIAIIEDGEIILQKGYGFSNVEKERKVDIKTGFNIASMSKTIAAWGLMKLVQDGKIDLDAPAEKYLTRWQLPKSAFNSSEVTIRRLLSHTAGVSLHGYPGWSPSDTLPTIEESLNGKNNGPGRVEIIMKPGLKYQYSGGGFTILQLIIEEVTGQKFEDYMQQQILNPLGMTNSSYKIDGKITAASASEYDDFGEEIDFELFTAKAAAGLHTTLEDFTLFTLANLQLSKGNPVLSADIIRQMMEPVPAAKGNYGYGLGYEIDMNDALLGLKGHNGDNAGWHAMFRVDPATNDGFIVFTNGGAGYNIVSMMFCEWVTWRTGKSLWGGCSRKRPISGKLKQIIDDKGIEGIAAAYAALKDEWPDEYNFSEDQLNNLGYYYMSQEKLEEAIVIFKLNVDAYPNDYNVYDSYGEALLAQGDREEAIENYKKSVELNPGSAHGVKVLNELGISNDDLSKSLSVAVDDDLLAGYVGRYQTSAGDRAVIQVHGGLLTAEIQGQRLNLVAESEARFQALGDGSIVTFFTAATGQKGLWASGKIWRKLPQAPAGNFLVFRNKSSWGRLTDFENVLTELGCNYEQRKSSAMADLDLSAYEVIIIPGAQDSAFYDGYVSNAKRFDEYVAAGGTLILELNGAERNKAIALPLGVTIVPNKAIENAIIESNHPIFHPLSGKRLIRARYVSNGYLRNLPDEVLILAIEAAGTDTYTDRPTFIEYTYGKGRVIAASQCFHDQDGSGRGPLMESIISYVLTNQ